MSTLRSPISRGLKDTCVLLVLRRCSIWEVTTIYLNAKKLLNVALAVMFLTIIAAVPSTLASQTQTGNGAPSGPHYNLNLVGIEKGGSASITSNGHVIFVPLYGNCKIDLQMGDYQVIDPNCLQGNALFQLPNPNDTSISTTQLAYSVWVRVVAGKGSSSLQGCYTNQTSGESFCNTGSLVVNLNKVTPPKFTDVSKQLLQVCVNGQESALFSNSNFNYFWQYNNTGVRLAQMRFYPIQTTTLGGSC